MVQDEIFRFMNLRPARKAALPKVVRDFAVYDIKKKPGLQESIEKLSGPDAHVKSLELARAQLAVARPAGVQPGLAETVKKAAISPTAAAASDVIRSESSMDPATLLKDPGVTALREWYWNMLLAHSLLPEVTPEKRSEIFDGIRAFHFLDYLTRQSPGDRPMTPEALNKIRPLIPRSIFIDHAVPDDLAGAAGLKALKDRWAEVRQQIESLAAASEEIRNTERLYRTRQPVIVHEQTVTAGSAGVKPAKPGKVNLRSGNARIVTPLKELAGKEGITTLVREYSASWIFSEYAAKNLSEPVKNLMKGLKEKTEEMNVGKVLGILEKRQYDLAVGFAENLPEPMIGHADSLEGFRETLKKLAVPDMKFKVPFPKTIPDPTSPMGRGIKPLGIGDLLVVKQKLVKYEAGEVAHVENVLKSEFKTRTHTRISERETVEEKLEESEKSTEKDSQSTERYELSSETQKAIQEQTNVNAGVSLTAGYGPVSLSTHADFAISMSESESDRTASSFAKDVTERAVSRITQRVREQRKTRTLERIEERNEHGFDNKAGSGHVIGVYRWLDKYYKARLINYGKRLMLEFIVPEPGAFFILNEQLQENAGVDIKKPKQPAIGNSSLDPSALHKSNYMDFVAEYNVQDAEPYPEEWLTVSASVGETVANGTNADFAKTYDTWVIPEGYEVEGVYGSGVSHGYGAFGVHLRFGGVEFGGSLAGLEGIISISVSGVFSSFQLNMVAVCRPTEKAIAKWQLKMFQSIMNAYNLQLAAYNEKVAAAAIQAGVKIEGRNPGINRKIEADELRKGVLRILTNNFAKIRLGGTWRYNEKFCAMQDNGEYGYPEFNIVEAMTDGKIIQFFEQAMEWANMTYYFYPYFWARKNKWASLFPISDPDPLFTQFLRSGAARVIVPVQPEYTETVLHYMATNELWNGGQPPTINDELYISIVDEMRAENGLTAEDELAACSVDSGYPCVVDEWDVKLPTDLVYLQPDSTLPDFTGPE